MSLGAEEMLSIDAVKLLPEPISGDVCVPLLDSMIFVRAGICSCPVDKLVR